MAGVSSAPNSTASSDSKVSLDWRDGTPRAALRNSLRTASTPTPRRCAVFLRVGVYRHRVARLQNRFRHLPHDRGPAPVSPQVVHARQPLEQEVKEPCCRLHQFTESVPALIFDEAVRVMRRRHRSDPNGQPGGEQIIQRRVVAFWPALSESKHNTTSGT